MKHFLWMLIRARRYRLNRPAPMGARDAVQCHQRGDFGDSECVDAFHGGGFLVLPPDYRNCESFAITYRPARQSGNRRLA